MLKKGVYIDKVTGGYCGIDFDGDGRVDYQLELSAENPYSCSGDGFSYSVLPFLPLAGLLKSAPIAPLPDVFDVPKMPLPRIEPETAPLSGIKAALLAGFTFIAGGLFAVAEGILVAGPGPALVFDENPLDFRPPLSFSEGDHSILMKQIARSQGDYFLLKAAEYNNDQSMADEVIAHYKEGRVLPAPAGMGFENSEVLHYAGTIEDWESHLEMAKHRRTIAALEVEEKRLGLHRGSLVDQYLEDVENLLGLSINDIFGSGRNASGSNIVGSTDNGGTANGGAGQYYIDALREYRELSPEERLREALRGAYEIGAIEVQDPSQLLMSPFGWHSVEFLALFYDTAFPFAARQQPLDIGVYGAGLHSESALFSEYWEKIYRRDDARQVGGELFAAEEALFGNEMATSFEPIGSCWRSFYPAA